MENGREGRAAIWPTHRKQIYGPRLGHAVDRRIEVLGGERETTPEPQVPNQFKVQPLGK